MSEYQYYEFQAVDRPLSSGEMAELRVLSTRATITSTRFTNFYNWGDLRGDPATLVERYFDAFVYVANWGTHRLMLRLPKRLLDAETVSQYCNDETLHVREVGEHVVVTYTSEDESGWVDDEESEGWMPALLPLRSDLAAGDLRCLYTGWLAGLPAGMLDEDVEAEAGDDEGVAAWSDDDDQDQTSEDDLEPPVPAGLGRLSAPLQALADFLRVDEDLLAVAAEGSAPDNEAAPSRAALAHWIAGLPESEKNSMLLRLLETGDPHLRAELLRRRRAETAGPAGAPEAHGSRRAVEQLLTMARKREEGRRLAEARQAAEEQARRQREQAIARARYLDQLSGREAETWQRVDVLIDAKRPADYDRAVQLLVDLRDLHARNDRTGEFAARLSRLREQHATKRGLLQRLDKSGLTRTR